MTRLRSLRSLSVLLVSALCLLAAAPAMAQLPDTKGLVFSDTPVTVTEAAGDGRTATYTVALATRPTAAVTVMLASADTTAATVAPTSLIFTTENWGNAQMVTVTAVDDNLHGNGRDSRNRTTQINHTASGGDYASLEDSVGVTVSDDEASPEFSIADVSVAEGDSGEEADLTFTVTLSPPTNYLATVDWATSDGTATKEEDYSAGSGSFPNNPLFFQGSDTHTITVKVKGDEVVEPHETLAVTLSNSHIPGSDLPGPALRRATATGTILDDDAEPRVLFDTDSVTVAEGDTATYTVRLATMPEGTVTVTPKSDDETAATVSGPLIFNSSNWYMDQEVTVTGVQDDDGARENTSVSHSVTGYDDVTSADPVQVTVTDDDAEILLSKTFLTVWEGLPVTDNQTYKVRLAAEPAGTVTVTPKSRNPAKVAVSVPLTFNTQNWKTWQDVVLTGVLDEDGDDHRVMIDHSVMGYEDAPPPASVQTSVRDYHGKSLVVQPRLLGLIEGRTGVYRVKLRTDPGGVVTVTPRVENESVATVSGALTFNSSNWSVDQEVTVTGKDVENYEQTTITHMVSGYQGYTKTHPGADFHPEIAGDDISTVAVAIADTDSGFAVLRTAVTVTEPAGARPMLTYIIALAREPTAPVTVEIASGDESVATVNPAMLTFTPSNWSQTQGVTVTGVDDDIVNDTDRTTVITHSASGTYGNFRMRVTVKDDDVRGLVFTPDAVTVTEAAGASRTATYTVKLASQPTGPVSVALASGDEDAATVSPKMLNFTTVNWDDPQTVTVTGVDDTMENIPERTTSISHTASGGDYGSVTGSVGVTVSDDDHTRGLVFTPDTVTVTEAAGDGRTATYTVALATRPTAAVTVTLASADTTAATVMPAKLDFTTENWGDAQPVTVTAVDDNLHGNSRDSRNRTTQIDHTASGGDYRSVDGNVQVTVTDDEASPEFSIADFSVVEGDSGDEADLTFTITLSPPTNYLVAAAWTTNDGTATAGEDYIANSRDYVGFEREGENASYWTFEVKVKGDDVVEPDETLTVTLSKSSILMSDGLNLPVTATGTIDDDDAPSGITLTVDADTGTNGVQGAVDEDGGAKTVQVTATVNGGTRYPAPKTVTVAVGASADTATEGTDYQTVGNLSITIAAGAASGSTTFTLTPTDDSLDEADEKISLDGTSSGGETVTDAEITITDDDDAPSGITLTVDADTGTNGVQGAVDEDGGAKTVQVTATVNGGTRYPAPKTVTVAVGASADTATEGTDYQTVGNLSITIAAGAASGSTTFTLTPTDDSLDEADEKISLDGTSSGGETVTDAEITITDDDDAPSGITLTVDADTGTNGVQGAVDEDGGAKTVQVTATVNGGTRYPAPKTVTVAVGASADTATEGTDYQTVGNLSITIAAGAASGSTTFTLTPTDDSLDEADEKISLDGTSSGGETVTDAEITITDDDDAPSGITLTVDADTGTNGVQGAVDEDGGAKTVQVTATVNGGTRYPAPKTVTVAVGASADTATEGTDYQTVGNLSITIAAGAASGSTTFTLTPTDDSLDEADEKISLDGTSSGGETVTDAEITITDDDDAPSGITLTVDADTGTNGVQGAVDEDGGAKTVQVTATVNGGTRYPAPKTVTVAVGASADTATEGTDYQTVGNLSITIAAGAASGSTTFTLTPTDDSLDEADEKISLDGTSSGGETVTDAEITITDDDDAPSGITLTVDADTGTNGVQGAVDEDGGAKTVQVTATVNGGTRYPAPKTVTVAVGASADTATEGTDYQTVGNLSITIAAGAASGSTTFTLTPTDDSLDEADEKISLDGTSSGGETVTDAEITITDDDDAPSGITLTVDADTGTNGVQGAVDEDGGAKTVQVTATVNGGTRYPAPKTVTVAVGASADTATEGTDYQTVGNLSITIAAGAASGSTTFTLTPTDDSLDEADEKISLDGTSSGGETVTDAEITITDDDDAPSGITLTVDADTGTNGVQGAVDEDGGAKTVQVTATVNGGTRYPAPKTVTVAVGASADTATEGTDYQTVGNLSITIAAGAASGSTTFTLTPTDDSLDEADEKISLDGTSSGGETVTDAEITITDDDDAPSGITLTVDADTGTNGVQGAVDEDGGAKTVQVTATVNGGTRYPAPKTVTVAVGASADTATEGTDYQTVGNLSITIAAGAASGSTTFTLTPTDDSLDEADEKISLDGTSSGGETVTDAEITITDDDDAPSGITLTVDADTGTNGVQGAVDEDGGAKTVQVTATVNGGTRYPAPKTVTVAVGASADTATEGTDYQTVGNLSITIAAGAASGSTTFTLTPTDDSLDEADEKISLDGTSSGGETVTDAEITITDDDDAPSGITLTVDADTGTNGVQGAVDEDGGAKTVQVTATVNGGTRYPAPKTVTVAVGASADTATEGTDYQTVGNLSITIAAGAASGSTTFTLTPTDDSLDEADEKISLDGTSSGGETVTDAEITITDDDDAPSGITLTVDADTGTNGVQGAVDEDGGAKTVQVTATVNGGTRYPAPKTVTVAVGASADTATEGTDYQTVGNLSITIAAGAASGSTTFTLTPTDDSLDEADEKISLDGTSSGGETVTDAEITITDDDDAPSGITLTVDADTGTNGVQGAVDEDGGAKTVQVTATVNGGTRYPAPKTVTVAVGASADTATEGTDYQTVGNLSITIAAGAASGSTTFTLTPTDDSLDEADEKISLDGTSSGGETVTDAEITITDDDDAPSGITLTVDADTGTNGVQGAVDEDGGAKTVQVTATVNGGTRYPAPKTVTVAVGASADTATEGTDYQTVGNLSITIAAGAASGSTTFTLTPTDDSLDEADEKISLDGTSSGGETVTDAEITITDDDDAPSGITLTVDADTGTNGVQGAVDEDGGAKTVQVTATVNGGTRYPAPKTVTVAVGASADTATEGTDYQTVGNLSITIAAGAASGSTTFTLTPTDDSLDEADEKISLDGTSSGGETVTDAEITITDDDDAPSGITLTVDADTGTNGVQGAVDEDGGAKTVQVTATVNGGTRYPAPKTVTVAVGASADTATEGTDYQTVGNLSITIAAGAASGSTTFTLTPTDDSLDEADEKISLDGTSSGGETVTDAEITITDDDDAPSGITLTVDADTGTNGVQGAVDEDGGAKTVQVTATVNGGTRYPAPKTVTVAVGASADTATEGTDYQTVGNLSITIAAGAASGSTTFTLTPTDDSLDEADEKISLDGTSSGGETVTDAEITITDDDDAPSGITLTVDADTGTNGVQGAVDEDGGAKTVQVTATVNGGTRYPAPKTVTVAVGASADTATEGTDYQTVGNLSITIAAGAASGSTTFTLTPTDDSLDEADEKISLDGTSSGGETVTDAEITITDDDDAPSGITLTVDADTGTNGVQGAVDEDGGAKTVQVTATVNGGTRYPAPKTVTVAVGASADTATEGTDYQTVGNLSITIAAGAASGSTTFTLTPTDDSLDEADEKISLDGTSSGGETVTDAEITITDDDDAPSGITLTVDADTGTNGVQGAVDEDGGAKTVQVTATVNGGTRYPAPKTVTVAVGASADTATEGTDYQTVGNLSITIAAGAASGSTTFTLTPTDDSLDEADEKISLDGTSSGGETVTDAEITITDDDDAPSGITLTVDADTGTNGVQGAVDEDGGAKTVQVTATVNGGTRYPAPKTVTVAVGASADTATEGTDYQTVGNLSITIAAGAASGSTTFTLTPTDDSLDEADEKISLDGTSSGGETVTDAEITITDDDDAPSGITLTVDADTGTNGVQGAVDEDGGAKTVQVTATVNGGTRYPAPKTVTVAVGASADTATEGTDYQTVGNLSITIAAGAASGSTTFTLTPTDDSLDEADEKISLDGTSSGGETVTDAEITITDDDDAPSGITLTVDADTGTNGVQGAVDEDGGAKTVQVTATVNGGTRYPAPKTVTVAVGASADTATEGTDYQTVGNLSITIAAGAASGSTTFTLTPTDDSLDEADEKISLDGTSSGGETVTDAEITITDDDDAPSGITLTVDADTGTNGVQGAVDEDGGAKTVQVTATVNGGTRYPAPKTVTVAVGASADTATEGTDYQTVGNLSITIAAGAASGSTTFTLTPTDDSLDEADEKISLDGTSSGGETVTDAEITITDDDDAPSGITLTVDADTGTNGVQGAVDEDGGAKTVQVTATVNGGTRYPAPKTVTVAVGASADTATEGTDYQTVGNLSITIAAGAASGSTTFTLTPTDDSLDEADEKISLDGTSSGGETVTDAEITITDDDDAPSGITLTVDADTGTNGVQGAVDEDGGAKTVQVTATVNGGTRYPAPKTVTVAVGASADTATEGTDYQTVGNLSITIAAGAASGSTTFTLTPTDDSLDEADEKISLDGTSSGGETVTDAEITITDDDDAPSGITLTVDADTGTNGVQGAVDEDGGAKTVQVTATVNGGTRYPAPKTVTVAVGASADTATEGTDYQTVGNLSITIAAGAASGSTTFTLTPTDDSLDEADEKISLDGTSSGGETVTDAEITITDDDDAPSGITLTVDADTGTNGVQGAVDEDGGAKTVQVTATVNGGTRYPAPKTVTVAVGASADTATEGTDYQTVGNLSITIAAGAASGSTTFTLTPTDDSLDEADEKISLDGTSSGGETVTDAEITITDDDDAELALVLTTSEISENGGVSTVRAILSGASSETVRLTVSAQPVAPAEDGNFSLSGSTLTIAAGSTSSTGTVTITAIDNDLYEPDKMVMVSAAVSGGHGVTAPEPQILIIRNDDERPSFSIADARVEEGEIMAFVVTRTGASGSPVSVIWTTAPHTDGKHPASAADYTPVTNARTLNFGAGETHKIARVQTIEDTLDEPDETFLARLSDPTGHALITVDGGQATGTIEDDDRPPVVSIVDAATVMEGETASFPVRLSAASGKTITMDWITSPGTATEDADYVGSEGRITILPGSADAQIEVVTIDDTEIEDKEPETFTVTLSMPANVTIDESVATGTIEDDDRPAAITRRIKRVNRSVLPRVASALIRNRIDQLTDCIDHARSGHAGVKGFSGLEQSLERNMEALNWKEISLHEALADMRLAAKTPSSAQQPGFGDLAFCAGADWRRLSSTDDGPVSWEGSLFSASLGGNMRLGENVLAGLDISLHESSVDWGDRTDAGIFEGDWRMHLNAVHPYLARFTQDGQGFWLMAGYGWGNVRIVEETPLDESANLRMKNLAIGGVLPLTTSGGNTSLRLRGNLWRGEFRVEENGNLIEDELSIVAQGVRILADAKWRKGFANGASLEPSARIGLQYDDGACACSMGLEVGPGLRWNSPAQKVSAVLSGRFLVLRGGVQEWGVSGSVRVGTPDGLGPSLSVSPSWGNTADRTEALWENGLETTLSSDNYIAVPSLHMEAGWGLRVAESHVLTPFADLSLSGDAKRNINLGGRLKSGEFGLEIAGTRRESTFGSPEHGLFLKMVRNW